MVNDNKIKNHIDDSLKKGYSLKQIEQALLSGDYDPSKVTEVLLGYKKKQPLAEKKMMMNKKLLFLVGGIVLIVIVILFFAFFYKPSVGDLEEPPSTEEKEEIITVPVIELTFDEDLQECVEVALINASFTCSAYAKDDITLCEKDKMKEKCKSNYQLFKALAGQSCETIDDPTNQARILCECLVSGNTAKCETADFEYEVETLEDKNIFYNSIANRDSSDCNKISKKEGQEMCSYSVHITLALMNSNVKECEKLPGLGDEIENQIKFCKALVTKDYLLCVQEEEEEIISYCKENIITKIKSDGALSTGVCEQIEDEEGKMICFDLLQESQ